MLNRPTHNAERGSKKAAAISVVIPSFNSTGFIPETLDSLFRQSTDDFEIIIVDDGSTDNSVSVIREIAAAHPQSDIVVLELENGGVACARNKGISTAQGDYIMPLDADDLVAPDMLQRCRCILDEKGAIDIVYTDRRDFGDYEREWESGNFELSRLKYFNQLGYCAMYRKEVWERVGGYRSDVSGFDDWDFWIRAANLGLRAYHISLPLFLHRRTRSSQLWNLLEDYESLFANIILNNPGVYSEREKYGAESYLKTGKTSALLRTTKLMFTELYYSGYR